MFFAFSCGKSDLAAKERKNRKNERGGCCAVVTILTQNDDGFIWLMDIVRLKDSERNDYLSRSGCEIGMGDLES